MADIYTKQDDTRVAHVSGYEVYHSPEFKALCKRFGIALGLPTRSITITLTEDEFLVEQKYLGRGEVVKEEKATGTVETTTMANKVWRTYQPKPDHVAGRLDK